MGSGGRARRLAAPSPNNLGHADGHGLRVLVLPRSHKEPPVLAKSGLIATVAGDVPSNLRSPVVGIRSRSHAVVRAAVPDAAVDGNGHSLSREDDIS